MSVAPIREAAGSRPATAPWWRAATGYEVYLRSFADGDGDGVGDLPGLLSRLDHLAWLGIDLLWITPFYPSPMADHGYDIADQDAAPPSGSVMLRGAEAVVLQRTATVGV